MSKIVIDIKSNFINVYKDNENEKKDCPIAFIKDNIVTINETTNKTDIKLMIEVIYSIGLALMQKIK